MLWPWCNNIMFRRNIIIVGFSLIILIIIQLEPNHNEVKAELWHDHGAIILCYRGI